VSNYRVHITGAIVVFFSLVALFWVTDLDLRISALAWQPQIPNWPYDSLPVFAWLRAWSFYPGILLGAASGCVLAASYISPKWKSWRQVSLYFLLLLVLGPGLIVNGVTKSLFGRIRPEQIIQFGGQLPFFRPFEMGLIGKGWSLLSGHASMGFLFMGFFFVWRGWKGWVALFFGGVFGILIGVARVAQGAHFASDVLLCGAIMYLTSALLASRILTAPSRTP
jgi:lipid A 4'-phosphatase